MSQLASNTALASTAAAAGRRPELLAPAGDWECAKAAVENGADAIYFGLEKFNARMRAHNFTVADLPKLMEFLHRRGVKGYVTFNTLVFANELAEAEQHLRAIIAAGVDAAIVQDIGICRLIRRLSPDFPIHASTQMTVTSAAGVAFARELGCNLVVLARECSIAELEKIQAAQRRESVQCSVFSAQTRTADAPSEHRTLNTEYSPLPLEVFVHGALCVAYSGQCLTSEALGGRSANRGECAQACRMPYDLISDGQSVPLGDRRYLLSPQDLSGLDVLPDLVRAGVSSLKIEGRLKSPEYVASITRVYRQALDRLGARNTEHGAATMVPDSEAHASRYELEMSFSRGLSTGWFRGINNQQLVHARFGKKRGVFLGEVTRINGERVGVTLAAPLKPGDGVVFDAGHPDQKEEGGFIYTIEPRGREVMLGFGRGDIDFTRVHIGDKLWKTSDPELEKRLRQTFAGDAPRFQRPVHFEVHGHAGAPLTLIARDDEGHEVQFASTMPLAAAQKRPMDEAFLREQLGRLGGTPFQLGELVSRLEGAVILPMSELNRLRREAVAQLEALRAQPKRWALDVGQASRLSRIEEQGAEQGSSASQIRAGQAVDGSREPAPSREEGSLPHPSPLPLGEGTSPTVPGEAEPSAWSHGGRSGSLSQRERAGVRESGSVFSADGQTAEMRLEGAPSGIEVRDRRDACPTLVVLVRNMAQLEAALRCGVETLYCEFEDPKKYREAVARVRELSTLNSQPSTVFVAPPRIFKSGEEWTLKLVRSSEADGYLVRNYDHLQFFADCRRVGDFSLNVANPLTAQYFIERFGLERVTASYDLNFAQLEALLQGAPPEWFELTIHQHMPMFHMEHCVFCAFLSTGTDYTNCGRPCDHHDVRLRDRVGAEHPLKADAGCRNTVFNSLAQTGAEYVSRMLALGARRFRLEFLNETPEEVERTIGMYRRLLAGELTGAQLWRELKLRNQLGVTRGQMEG